MNRITQWIILSLVMVCGAACSGERSTTMVETPNAPVFPPTWNQGDSWTVQVRIPAPAPADLEPYFAERAITYRVKQVPDETNLFYLLEATSDDFNEGISYQLLYRKNDRSVAKVTQLRDDEPPEVILENEPLPYLDAARQAPLILDFPLGVDPDNPDKEMKFTVGSVEGEQTSEKTADGLLITLEATEPALTLQVVMEWNRNEPWWSKITCREIGPGSVDLPPDHQIIASGHLLKD